METTPLPMQGWGMYVCVYRKDKALSPSQRLPQKEDFPSERAREWVVDSEPTNDEGLGGVK